METAKIILNQMGGIGKLKAMINAKDFVADNDSINFKFSGYKLANIVNVSLNEDDTYTVKFYKYNNRTLELKETNKIADVYCNMLIDIFENVTGLRLSL